MRLIKRRTKCIPQCCYTSAQTKGERIQFDIVFPLIWALFRCVAIIVYYITLYLSRFFNKKRMDLTVLFVLLLRNNCVEKQIFRARVDKTMLTPFRAVMAIPSGQNFLFAVANAFSCPRQNENDFRTCFVGVRTYRRAWLQPTS